MPRVQITETQVMKGAAAGLDIEAADLAAETTDGNSFAWRPGRVVHVLNGDDASITVTVPTPGTVGKAALAIADASGAVAAGARKAFGPFGREFVQSTGLVHLDFVGTTMTGVMIGVVDYDPA